MYELWTVEENYYSRRNLQIKKIIELKAKEAQLT